MASSNVQWHPEKRCQIQRHLELLINISFCKISSMSYLPYWRKSKELKTWKEHDTKKKESACVIGFIMTFTRLSSKSDSYRIVSNLSCDGQCRYSFNFFCQPVLRHWPLTTTPENIRKPLVLLCFQGVSNKTSGMKWVEQSFSPFLFPSFLSLLINSFRLPLFFNTIITVLGLISHNLLSVKI